MTKLVTSLIMALGICSGNSFALTPTQVTLNPIIDNVKKAQKKKPKKLNKHCLVGSASWYGKQHHGRKTASGEVFNMYKMTAAHKTLPLGTKIKVTNLDNGKTVIVKVNDRGPFSKNRVLDLSFEAAKALQMVNKGHTNVIIEII
ncbi:MAG: septal ring lytic transglycosylase RlpA family protein [Spirochaetes bacterium]|nr:MAG: septal ring lytic transglycosylase RlpA family protein [Spirochaetota bacterium]